MPCWQNTKKYKPYSTDKTKSTMNHLIHFSFSRLVSVIKRDLVENWKTNLYRILTCYIIFGLIFIFMMYGMNHSSGNSAEYFYERFCGNVTGIIYIALNLYMCYFASLILEPMRTKERRISYLMLPATLGEKFVSRALYVTIGTLIIFGCGLLMAELTRLLFVPILGVSEEFGRFCLADVWHRILAENQEPTFYGESDYSYTLLIMFFTVLITWSHSLYILGGSFFRKKAFIKTMGLCFLLMILFGNFFVQIFEGTEPELIKWLEDWTEANPTQAANTFLSIGFSLFLLLTVLNWGLSYKLFATSQITERKLFRR